ncbi:MAG TPA: AraC family transcriptional regulator [Clostridiales bacterium]|nr:AraC family transcriptional regulator [Clostridiales bacterium]
MCTLGINVDTFNPRIFYIFKRKFGDQDATKYHCHDFISFIYVLSGGCTYNLDGFLYQLKKGDLIICNPGVYHCRLMNTGQEVIEFHVGFSNISLADLQRNYLIPENSNPVFKISRYEQDFLRCCSEIVAEQEKDEPGCEPLLKSLVMKLIVLFLRETSTHRNSDKSAVFNFDSYDRLNIVNTIVSYINENYMNDISLDKISKNMYLSPVYISKIFKEEIGESPINYLIKVRLAKALELLENGDLTVRAIAKSVGYDDAYHFSKLFKKYYGSPPSKFRNK